MTLNEIFLIIAMVAIVVLAVTLIPVLLQLKRTARKAEIVMGSLDQQLPHLLTTLNQTADELHTLSKSINKKLDDTDVVIRTLMLAGESLFLTSNLFRKTVSPIISQVGGISSGLKTFFGILKLTGPRTKEEDK